MKAGGSASKGLLHGKENVKLTLCLISQAHSPEDIWGSGGIVKKK
jgi:hypothetical protein